MVPYITFFLYWFGTHTHFLTALGGIEPVWTGSDFILVTVVRCSGRVCAIVLGLTHC